jgi:hypothetical protein
MVRCGSASPLRVPFGAVDDKSRGHMAGAAIVPGTMKAAAILALALIAPAARALNAFSHTGAQGVNFWRLKQARGDSKSVKMRRATPQFPQYNFTQPLDHFAPPGGVTFEQRYWVSTRHYNASSPGPVPVIVLDAGESDGGEHLSLLDTGIVDILAKATGGVGVVLEHR